eukprot:NODE_15493_length_1047_cov_5.580435.p1 GENE.NODE_15493_length_1047_cov_5.580435~~NODE_15493_length_1047_cov_5.580435.p1  ORF type:complete len:299 (-),score=60.00 NODE_15493_length_1047_cov_5.580435:56-952(-)
MAAPGMGSASSYSGTVKSFSSRTGWGLILCDATYRLYNKDMFFLKTSLPHGFIDAGHHVRFDVAMGLKGPEATNISVWEGPMQDEMPMQQQMLMQEQMPFPMQHQQQQHHYQQQQQPAESYAAYASATVVYYGRVKSFNAQKGWGMIACEQTFAFLGKDVFVMISAVPNNIPLRQEQHVQFKLAQGRRGLEASEVVLLDDAGIDDGTICQGIVKSYNPEKGWGFIQCDSTFALYNKDLFVHSQEVGGHVPSVGDTVTFHVGMGKGDRPEAKGLSFGEHQPQRGHAGQKAGGGVRAAPY